MQQVVCVWLPNFGMQRFLNEHEEFRSQPCVLYEDRGPRGGRITDCSHAAKRCGIARGMPLADAQALVDTNAAHFEVHQAEFDTLALNELARGCQRFSPFVAVEQRDGDFCLLIDATGATHLFGGPRRLVVQISVYLQQQGYFSQVAFAHSIGAAWAICRFGHCTGSARSIMSLPVEALRLPEKIVARLHQFDLRRIGQVVALPQESLPSRFGEILTTRIGQFRGKTAELLNAIKTPDPITESWVTDDAINNRRAVALVCRQLVETICSQLQKRGEGMLRLEMDFFGSADEYSAKSLIERADSERSRPAPVSLELPLVTPVNEATYIDTLLTLRLERQRLPEWIHCIEARAAWTAALEIRQQSLFADPQQRDPIHGLLNHLTARLGESAVVRPTLQPEIEPENAVRYDPVNSTPSAPPSSSRDHNAPDVRGTGHAQENPAAAYLPASARPLQLFEHPQPVRVIELRADSSPARFIWKGRHFHIEHSTRVERIQTAWWRSVPICRDYFRVETKTGQRFWLFCDTRDRWFLHGVFE